MQLISHSKKKKKIRHGLSVALPEGTNIATLRR